MASLWKRAAPTKPSAEVCPCTMPAVTLEDLVLSTETREAIRLAAGRWRTRLLVRRWLGGMDANAARVAINFHGPPGTGKSMAAEALAHMLERPLLQVEYGELESRFVGGTSKNITTLFRQAREQGAVLVFDEADAALSKRIAQPANANDALFNQARAVLLLELERFDGAVVFTTNLPRCYDPAFVRRIGAHIPFPLPDRSLRRQLWQRYLPATLPQAPSVCFERLAAISEGLSPADMALVVRQAAVRAALRAGDARRVTLTDLTEEIKHLRHAQRTVGVSLAVRQAPTSA